MMKRILLIFSLIVVFATTVWAMRVGGVGILTEQYIVIGHGGIVIHKKEQPNSGDGIDYDGAWVMYETAWGEKYTTNWK